MSAADPADDHSIECLFGKAISLTWLASSESWPAFEYLAQSCGTTLPERSRVSCPAATAAAATASDTAIAAVDAASQATRGAGIISPNDILEDLSTRSLRFVLLPLLGSMAHSAWQGSGPERLAHLEAAKSELNGFFNVVDALGLLSHSDRDRVIDGMPDLIQTPQQRRDALIERHKKEKLAAEKLKTLLTRRATRADVGDDEELGRDAILTILESGVRRGMDSMSSIDRELEVLRFAVAAEARGVDPAALAARDKPKGPPPGLNGLPSTFRIVDRREKAREAVFRPSHSLPTYTVEEWGQIEMQRAVEAQREKNEREIVKAKAAAEEDSDGDEASNRETYEKRRWDDWKDDHNKGSGNTLR